MGEIHDCEIAKYRLHVSHDHVVEMIVTKISEVHNIASNTILMSACSLN